MILIFDPIFKVQLSEIFKFGKKQFGKKVATDFKFKISSAIKLLKSSPEMGQEEYTLCTTNKTYRYLLVLPYKIIYSIDKDTIRIHFLWHTSQAPDKMKMYVSDDSEAIEGQ